MQTEPQQSGVLNLEESDSAEDRPPAAEAIEIGPGVAAMLGLTATAAPTSAATRTSHFNNRTISNGEDVFATLNNRTITATRMVNLKSGLPFVLLSYAYEVSSHGWRTGRGFHHGETTGAPHRIDFKNEAGGVMYSWHIHELTLGCGWHARSENRYHAERHVIDWFELWSTQTYHVKGEFYPCG